jgi:hypothetical protein
VTLQRAPPDKTCRFRDFVFATRHHANSPFAGLLPGTGNAAWENGDESGFSTPPAK